MDKFFESKYINKTFKLQTAFEIYTILLFKNQEILLIYWMSIISHVKFLDS